MTIKSIYQITFNNDNFEELEGYSHRIDMVNIFDIYLFYIKNNSDNIEHCYAIVKGYPSHKDRVFLDIFTYKKDNDYMRNAVYPIDEGEDKFNKFTDDICKYVMYGDKKDE